MVGLLVQAGIVFFIVLALTLGVIYVYARSQGGGNAATSTSRQSKGAREEN